MILRLTESRANCLRGKKSRKAKDLALSWSPSPRNKLSPGAQPLPIAGRLLYVELKRNGYRPQILWLFTTLSDKQAHPFAQIVKWYGLRWNVEINLRYLKTELGMEQLKVKSSQMAYKEFYAGILAYNLVRLFMYEAAVRNKTCITTLSYSSCRRLIARTVFEWGRKGTFLEASRLQKPLEILLAAVAKCRLPKRKITRANEPRKVCKMNRTFRPMSRSRQEERALLAQ